MKVDDGKVIGFAFAYIEESDVILSHLGVVEAFSSKGIGTKLLEVFESKVFELGFENIHLGALNGKENFYIKNGYQPLLLLQSQIQSIEAMKSINYDKVVDSKMYENVAQVFFDEEVSEDIRKKYENSLKDCHAIYMFSKIMR